MKAVATCLQDFYENFPRDGFLLFFLVIFHRTDVLADFCVKQVSSPARSFDKRFYYFLSRNFMPSPNLLTRPRVNTPEQAAAVTPAEITAAVAELDTAQENLRNAGEKITNYAKVSKMRAEEGCRGTIEGLQERLKEMSFFERKFTDLDKIAKAQITITKDERKLHAQHAKFLKKSQKGIDKLLKASQELEDGALCCVQEGRYEEAAEFILQSRDVILQAEGIAKTALAQKSADLRSLQESQKKLEAELSETSSNLENCIKGARAVRNGAIAIGAVVATGGAAGAGAGVLGSLAIGTGTGLAMGTTASIAEQGLEVTAYGKNLGEAVGDLGSQAKEDAKTSAIASLSTVGGLQVASKVAAPLARAFSSPKTARLLTGSTAGGSGGTIGSVLGEGDSYYQLRSEFLDELKKQEAPLSKKEEIQEKFKEFLTARGLEGNHFEIDQLARRMSIDIATAAFGGTIGAGGEILRAGKKGIREQAIFVGEGVTNFAVGATMGAVKDGEVTVEGISGEVVFAVLGDVIGGQAARGSLRTEIGTPQTLGNGARMSGGSVTLATEAGTNVSQVQPEKSKQVHAELSVNGSDVFPETIQQKVHDRGSPIYKLENIKELSSLDVHALARTTSDLADKFSRNDPRFQKLESVVYDLLSLAEFSRILSDPSSFSESQTHPTTLWCMENSVRHIQGHLGSPEIKSLFQEALDFLPAQEAAAKLQASLENVKMPNEFPEKNTNFLDEIFPELMKDQHDSMNGEEGDVSPPNLSAETDKTVTVQNRFLVDLSNAHIKKHGSEIRENASTVMERPVIDEAEILVSPRGDTVSMDALIRRTGAEGKYERSYTIPIHEGNELRPGEASFIVDVDQRDGSIQCPFGFCPVRIIGNDKGEVQVRQSISGKVFLSTHHGKQVEVVYEPASLPVSKEAQAWLEKNIPTFPVSIPKYMESSASFLFSDSPRRETKTQLLLQAIRSNVIYSLDSKIGQRLEHYGPEALQWLTDSGVGWCQTKSLFVANLLNGIGVPAWTLNGPVPDRSLGRLQEDPGHTVVAYVSDGQVKIFDPTTEARGSADTPIMAPISLLSDVREDAYLTRKYTLDYCNQNKTAQAEGGSSMHIQDGFHHLLSGTDKHLHEHFEKQQKGIQALQNGNLQGLWESWTVRKQDLPSLRVQAELKNLGLDLKDTIDFQQETIRLVRVKLVEGLSRSEALHALELIRAVAGHSPSLVEQEGLGKLTNEIVDKIHFEPSSFEMTRSLEKEDAKHIVTILGLTARDMENCGTAGLHLTLQAFERFMHNHQNSLTHSDWENIRGLFLREVVPALGESHIHIRQGFLRGNTGELNSIEQRFYFHEKEVRHFYDEYTRGISSLLKRYHHLSITPMDVARSLFISRHDARRSRYRFGLTGSSPILWDKLHDIVPQENKTLFQRKGHEVIPDSVRIFYEEEILKRFEHRDHENYMYSQRSNCLSPEFKEQLRRQIDSSISAPEDREFFYKEFTLLHDNTSFLVLDAENGGPIVQDPKRFRALYSQIFGKNLVPWIKHDPAYEYPSSVTSVLRKSSKFLEFARQFAQTSVADTVQNWREAFREDQKIIMPNLTLVDCQLYTLINEVSLRLPSEHPIHQVARILDSHSDLLFTKEEKQRHQESGNWLKETSPEFFQEIVDYLRTPEGAHWFYTFIGRRFSLDRSYNELAYFLEHDSSAVKFRECFGETLADMQENLKVFCRERGAEQAIEEIEQHRGSIPASTRDIFRSIFFPKRSTSPEEANIYRHIDMSGLLQKTLKGTLRVPELNLLHEKNKKQERLPIRRRIDGSEYDPTEFDLREVLPGQPLRGRIDQHASARNGRGRLVERVLHPLASNGKISKDPMTIFVHPDWLAADGGKNCVEYPERILSLMKAVADYQKAGMFPRIVLWRGNKLSVLPVHQPAQFAKAAEDLLRAAEEYAVSRTNGFQPEFTENPEVSLAFRNNERLAFLGMPDGSLNSLRSWARHLRAHEARFVLPVLSSSGNSP